MRLPLILSPKDCNTFGSKAQEDCHDHEDCHSEQLSESEEDPPVPQDCHTGGIESKEDTTSEESALETSKSEFYCKVDKRMAAISENQRVKHKMNGNQFNDIMNFLLSIRTATPEKNSIS